MPETILNPHVIPVDVIGFLGIRQSQARSVAIYLEEVLILLVLFYQIMLIVLELERHERLPNKS